jgi:hypothetical protein
MHCRAGQFAGQPSRVALRLLPWLTAGGSAACISRRRWHGFGEDGVRNGRGRGIPISRLGYMADSCAGRPHDRAAPTSPGMAPLRGDGICSAYTADTGLASFILRNFDADAWRSHAEGRWLAADTQGEQLVEPGSVIAVTEGARGRRLLHRPPRSRLLTSPLRRTPAAPPGRRRCRPSPAG